MDTTPTDFPNDELHNELAAHLAVLDGEAGRAPVSSTQSSAQSADPYRVERVLKESPTEVTQLAWFRGAAGAELGPFVRKLIVPDSGIGGAYRILFEAQRAGRRFAHLPRVVTCRELGVGELTRARTGLPKSMRACDALLEVVLEYVPGPTLREVIDAAAPGVRLDLAKRLMPALAEAVSELHEAFDAPVIHRDLTPGNVICPEGDPSSPVLIDLGIARTWHEGASSDTTHFGTRAYAPPEQFGFGQTDARTDVYALGLLAFFCLTASDPSPADRERGFAASGVPEAWRRVIARAVAFDPAMRHASARELGDAFAFLATEPAGRTSHARDAEPRRTASPNPPAFARAPAEDKRPEPDAEWPTKDPSPFSYVLATLLVVFSQVPVLLARTPAWLGRAWSAVVSSRVSALPARTPAWLGRVWNAAVLCFYALTLAGSVYAFANPTPVNSELPLWVLAAEYLVIVPMFITPPFYLVLDKRRLVARFPSLGRVSLARQLLVCIGVMAASAVLLLVVAASSGAYA